MRRLPVFEESVQWIDVYRDAGEKENVLLVLPSGDSFLVDWVFLDDQLYRWCSDRFSVEEFRDFVWNFYAARLYKDGRVVLLKDRVEREVYPVTEENWVLADGVEMGLIDGGEFMKPKVGD